MQIRIFLWENAHVDFDPWTLLMTGGDEGSSPSHKSGRFLAASTASIYRRFTTGNLASRESPSACSCNSPYFFTSVYCVIDNGPLMRMIIATHGRERERASEGRRCKL